MGYSYFDVDLTMLDGLSVDSGGVGSINRLWLEKLVINGDCTDMITAVVTRFNGSVSHLTGTYDSKDMSTSYAISYHNPRQQTDTEYVYLTVQTPAEIQSEGLDNTLIFRRFKFPDDLPVNYQPQLDDLDDRLDDAETILADHENRLDTAEATLTAHGNRLTSAENRITAAENKNSQQDTRLTNAETRITAAENKNNAQDSQLANHEGRLTNTEKTVTTHTSQIAEHEKRLEKSEKTIDEHTYKINNHENRLTSAESTINTHTSQIANHETQITQLRVDVDNILPITNAKMAKMSAKSIKANIAAVANEPQDITYNTLISDLANPNNSTDPIVPASSCNAKMATLTGRVEKLEAQDHNFIPLTIIEGNSPVNIDALRSIGEWQIAAQSHTSGQRQGSYPDNIKNLTVKVVSMPPTQPPAPYPASQILVQIAYTENAEYRRAFGGTTWSPWQKIGENEGDYVPLTIIEMGEDVNIDDLTDFGEWRILNPDDSNGQRLGDYPSGVNKYMEMALKVYVLGFGRDTSTVVQKLTASDGSENGGYKEYSRAKRFYEWTPWVLVNNGDADISDIKQFLQSSYFPLSLSASMSGNTLTITQAVKRYDQGTPPAALQATVNLPAITGGSSDYRVIKTFELPLLANDDWGNIADTQSEPGWLTIWPNGRFIRGELIMPWNKCGISTSAQLSSAEQLAIMRRLKVEFTTFDRDDTNSLCQMGITCAMRTQSDALRIQLGASATSSSTRHCKFFITVSLRNEV